MTSQNKTAVAIYAGTFDPITNGHIDLVARGTRMFERLILAIADNAEKNPLFSLAEREQLAAQSLRGVVDVEIIGFSGLLMDFCRRMNANVIVRGLRAVSDFEYEFQLASMNRRLHADIETVFLTPAEQYTFVSASLVKEIARYQGDVGEFVSAPVHAALKKKFARA